MYNKHEHFRQIKDVYLLTRICSEYVVSKTAWLCINNFIFLAYYFHFVYNYQLGRLLGKHALFFDHQKQIYPNSVYITNTVGID
jgi:hypothetical protein